MLLKQELTLTYCFIIENLNPSLLSSTKKGLQYCRFALQHLCAGVYFGPLYIGSTAALHVFLY